MSVTQDQFGQALLHADTPVPTGLQDGTGRAAGRRYDVYRNNVTHSLIEAMKTAFPLVRKVIGGENFDRLAPVYVRVHPPTSPLMMHYGAAFPDFLTQFQPLVHLGYLADCATLDLALRRSYHAADAAAFDPASLAGMTPEALMAQQFRLCPAAEVVRSDWPLFDIWRFNMEPDAAKPLPGAQDILITRPEFDPYPHLLPAGAALWLAELQQGHPLAQACETATATTPEFDLAATLELTLRIQAFQPPPAAKDT